ncbi:MAG TPA: alpha/beta fold hydrolase [Streptosporangiaceae bacterium]|nr:alpha/beta fold hydrolase [Streptosporangiaceae bacterium]
MQRTTRTPDGRTLAIEEAGDPDGHPVLVHEGTPNSRHLYPPASIDAAARGLRLISYDRPGYGGSSPQPGRTVADCAADVRAICANLGIDRLAMWGISGGGPHVLACAALLPGLVTAVASLASPAPMGAEGLDWFVGMGELNAEDIGLFLRDREAARAKLESDREEILSASAAEVVSGLRTLLSPTDAAVLKDALVDFLVYCHHEGLAPGGQGWWDDSVALGTAWGFELSAISVPVLLMHGRDDRFVPFGHGEWLAAHIPGVEARLLDHDGHVTLLANRIPEVHAWLADRL